MKNTETLKKNYEFRNVLTKGKGYFGKYINLYIIKEHSTKNKIGIAVGKKVGKAVKRNQLKRWIREIYTILEKNITYPQRIVFVLKKNISLEDVNFWLIKEDIEKLFKKAGIV